MKILRYTSTMFKDKYPGILLSQTVIFCSLYFKCFLSVYDKTFATILLSKTKVHLNDFSMWICNEIYFKFILTCGIKSNNDPSGWVAILPIGEKLTEKDSALDGIRTHASQILTGRCY